MRFLPAVFALVAAASLGLAAPADARPPYALASYSAAGAPGEPYPLAAVALTVGLAWIPIMGPTIGYSYAGDPIRGSWVGLGQVTAAGAGGFAGYLVGALVAPWLPPRAGVTRAEASQATADVGGAYGTLAALAAYTVWMAFDVHRLAAANAGHPEAF